MRMRTIEGAALYLKNLDPFTALTKTALRRLVVSGELPCVHVGQKYLIALEVLDAYLENGNALEPPTTACNGIRKVRGRG